MDVSIIIPTYNAMPKISILLNKLQAQNFKKYEIIVIDSTSHDNTAEIARSYGAKVIIIPQKDFNHGGTRNIAANKADGDILVFMTQDAIPLDDKCIENLVKPLNEPDIVGSYGRQIPNNDAMPVEVFARLFNYPDRAFVKSSSDIHRLGIKTFFFPNVFAAVRRGIFEEVGRFPDNIIMNEDVVLAAKLIDHGYKIAYSSDAKVYHSHNYSLHEQFSRYFDIGVALKSQSWILDLVKAEGEGLNYIKQEFKYLLDQKQYRWIPYMCLEAMLKFAGYRSGLIEDKIPVVIKKKLSMHSFYWADSC